MSRTWLFRSRILVLGSLAVSAASVLAVEACSSSNDAAPVDSGAPDTASTTASTDDPPIDPKYAAFAKTFDDERKAFGASGAAVALMENGKLTFFHGFGTKGPNSQDIVKATTLFRIGSMTKALTSTALLGLVQEGKVSLDATVGSLVPHLNLVDDANMPLLTVKRCLSHDSGLADYLEVDSSHDDSALEAFFTGTSGTQWGTHDYFMDPPGTFYDYSNPNFMLAGLVLEKIGGAPYRTAVHDRVLAPLGMNRTFFLPSEALADGDVTNASSVDSKGKPWDVAPDDYDNAWARPAGYAFSSVLDFEKFMEFLLHGNSAVLGDDLRAEMTSSVVPTQEPGPPSGYGYGVLHADGFRLNDDFYATPILSHDGAIPGFSTEWYMVPSTGFGIVAFANKDDAYFATSVVAAAQAFGGLPTPTPATDPAQDPAALAQIAGQYDDPHNVGHVVVTVSGSTLSVSMPDVDKAAIPYTPLLTPVGDDSFVLAIQGTQVEITFLKDATNAYTWLRTRPFVAKRSGDLETDGGTDGGIPDGGGIHVGGVRIPHIDARRTTSPLERLAHAKR